MCIRDSLKACMKLADGDKRIRVFHQEDLGSGAARNLGIENALGSYYYFADADDEVERDAVAKLVAEIETGRADLVVCGYSFVNRRRENLFTKSYERKLCKAEYIRKHYDDFIVMGKPYACLLYTSTPCITKTLCLIWSTKSQWRNMPFGRTEFQSTTRL